MGGLNPFARRKEGEVSGEQKEPFVEQSSNEHDEVENFDSASTTRSGCIAAVIFGAILSLLCLISGIYLLAAKQGKLGVSVSISNAGREIITLAVNIILALCTDGMMFIHSVSLRWALYHEGRLEFNTNTRLFTSSKAFGPNIWYVNLIALSCLVLSYASTSVLVLSDQTTISYFDGNEKSSNDPVMINATALVALGIGLAGQAIIATWCLVSSSKSIPTWSSNPLNTALAVAQKNGVTHRPGRCMLSVHQKEMTAQEAYPLKKQDNMFKIKYAVQYILALLWSLALLAIAWPITIAAVSKSIGNASALGQGFQPSCWRFAFHWDQSNLACTRNYVTLSFSPYGNDHKPDSTIFSYGAEAVLCILFVCLIQGIQTIALHCLELLVNLSRDEGIWRQAYSDTKDAPGTQLIMNPFHAAISSWENIFLFVSKALLHWIIGQSVIPSVVIEETKSLESMASVAVEGVTSLSFKNGFQFEMVYARLLIYAILAIVVAAMATFLALRRPRGCQPATMGHLQTLVDLIDDWTTGEGSRMWWGDKTQLETDEVRHAGTSCDNSLLLPIDRNAKYAGR